MKGGKLLRGFEKVGAGAQSKRKESSSSSFLAETPHESDEEHGDHQKEIARLTKLLEVQRYLYERKL